MKIFLGIRLPQELEEICERYRRAFKAPRTVAHITVIPPFTWEDEIQDLLAFLQAALKAAPSFMVAGAGIGSFGTRVLFINVNLSLELKNMQASLAHQLRKKGVSVDKRLYHPHITLATRLRPGQFQRYQAELANFSPDYSFLCSELSVFQLSEEGRWLECGKITLGN